MAAKRAVWLDSCGRFVKYGANLCITEVVRTVESNNRFSFENVSRVER